MAAYDVFSTNHYKHFQENTVFYWGEGVQHG